MMPNIFCSSSKPNCIRQTGVDEIYYAYDIQAKTRGSENPES